MNTTTNHHHQQHSFKLSRWYCWVSAVGAALAIVTAGPHQHPDGNQGADNYKYYGDHYSSTSTDPNHLAAAANTQQPNSVCWWDPLALLDSCKPPEQPASSSTPNHHNWNSEDGDHHKPNNNWWRWLLPPNKEQQAERLALKQKQEAQRSSWTAWGQRWARRWLAWLDPQLLHPSADTVTGLIDKVLTSTFRLLLIANWLMALTVLLHSAVADWFLGDLNHPPQRQQPQHPHTLNRAADPNNNNNNQQPLRAAVPPNHNSSAATSRERMGGFLIFKLLLISAVVTPDTLDVLILLSWYTVLSFLRSLASLGAQHTEQAQQHQQQTNNNNAQQHRLQHSGVWKLLAFCLCMDCSAAAVCVGLFHGAGTGMVLLLTCDCALLGVDCILNLVQYWQWVWEWQHADRLEQLEEEQDRLLATLQQQNNSSRHSTGGSSARHPSPLEEVKEEEGHEDEDPDMAAAASSIHAAEAEELSRELDRRMELLEQQQSRRTSWLESSIFLLQLLTDLLTIAHFLHIWSLHGVQLTLIDGVLALHLHSAIQSASKKILERRQLYKIARDMHGAFADASDLDLRKAAAAGDVCCICLGTMSYYHSNAFQFCSVMGTSSSATASPSNMNANSSHGSKSSNVKKVACGHLYHANCLREVIERARSMEAARCPLCRSSIVHGTNHTTNGNSSNVNATATARDGDAAVPAPPVAAGERALFRFSTENMFPVWMPLPAFSFEVVRRPANIVNAAVAAAPGNNAAAAAVNANNNAAARNNNVNDNNNAAVQQQTFLRRLLLLSGVVQMTAEEERVALEQLVDMFPQYDRQDLVAALRQRGSAEAVAETVLLGSFATAARER